MSKKNNIGDKPSLSTAEILTKSLKTSSLLPSEQEQIEESIIEPNSDRIQYYDNYKKYLTTNNKDLEFQKFNTELLPILEEQRDFGFLGRINMELSIYHRMNGDYDSFFRYNRDALEAYQKTGNSVFIATAFNSLANYHQELGDISSALQYYHQAFENVKIDRTSNAYYIIKHNLASIYYELNYFSKAKELFAEDLETFKEIGNYDRYAKAMLGIADIYSEEKRYKLAYKYTKLALENWDKTNDVRGKGMALAQLGKIMKVFEKYDEAIEYLLESKKILDSIAYKYGQLKPYALLGETYIAMKNYPEAIVYLEKAEEIAASINQRFELRKIYNNLYKAYEGDGLQDKAYQTIKKLTQLNENMFNVSLQAKVNEIQINFELEKKDIEYTKEREINEYKNNLFTYITHEFRTPLTLINTPLEMLKNEMDIDAVRGKIENITTHVQHMQHLLDQLLDINKIEEGKMPILKKAGSISPLLWHIVHLFEPEMSDKNIDFVYNLPKKNFQAYFDTDKIEKITSNLLSNAIKYTKDGGKIFFNASFDKNNLIIEVRDNGVGIDEQFQGEVFSKFYRIPDTSDVKGSGLGLSFVKELVTLLNGEISLESRVGQGSKFTVTIPIERIDKPPKEIKSVASSNSEESLPKQQVVMVVEDNYEILKLLRDVLNEKYKVYTADNGRDAIQKMKKHVPDIIISDIMMPLMNGIELCHFVKQDEVLGHIPVILLSAKSQLSDKIEGLESGADAYITKPFNISELQHTVGSILNQRKKIFEKFSSNVLNISEEELISADRVFVNQATEFVLKNIENEGLSVNDLARQLNMSRFTLIRKFKKINNSTPNTFIQKIRLEKAKELIKNKVANVTEIAFKVGFGSTTYFSYSFKKEFGMTPKEYYQSLE